ncbi:DUF4181 domain-containing protein [Rummeliibacillus sp. POC4]|uniref:DUF4181 domain-containing protein n=1 Tax=Rummeliibacillus sp. POC4 TaxID=2305899 RepID=UPI000E667424|nr:DUF4181 domain-containing protein [Rummeliibacillus sp. POC4]RIJ66922.1 hypothetical protein D1606_05305 [Rummeliibacillus sp. POC4]
MAKDLDQLLNELSTIERDPKQKQQSFQKLSKRIQHPTHKQFNKWKPAFALVMLVFVCSMYFLTLRSEPSTQNSVRAESMMELLKSDAIHFGSMDISTSHSLKYTPTGNPFRYFGFEKGVEPFSRIYNTEYFLKTAKPINNIDLKIHEISIRDVRVEYNNWNSGSEEILFLKFAFLDNTDKLLYVKDMNHNQWYKIEGEPAEKLQKLKYTSNYLDSCASIIYFYAGIYVLSFLIGAIIKDKFPIIKRTPIYIDKKHKYIDWSIRFGFILIIAGSLYYFGVIPIAMVVVLSFIYWGIQLYMELKHRPEAKRHYLIINLMIQATVILIGAIWYGLFR